MTSNITGLSSLIQRAQESTKRTQTDAQKELDLFTYPLDNAENSYSVAWWNRKFSMENNLNPTGWGYPDGAQYIGITSADGKTDTIDESDELGFSKTYIGNFSNGWDATPNSVTVQYYRPSTQYTYDKDGNCTQVRNYMDNKLEDQSVFQYDSNKRVIYRADDGGYKENADGKIDNAYTFEYCCESGNLISSTHESFGEYTNFKFKYEFDKNSGNLTKEIDADDNTIVREYEYDDYNRLASVTSNYAGKNEEYTFAYNADGNLATVFYDNKNNDNKFMNFINGILGKEKEERDCLITITNDGNGMSFKYID